jgi:hypothetical protein
MILRSRIAWLVACLAAGAAIGAGGQAWSGSAWWWLAIPVLLALVWLLIADPTRCDPRR